MPRIGFGCASNIHERELVAALSAGYRLFDTAQSSQWGTLSLSLSLPPSLRSTP
eukprot:COSAG03_NODE_26347_length_259_cov_1.762500_1_plen_53_part_10